MILDAIEDMNNDIDNPLQDQLELIGQEINDKRNNRKRAIISVKKFRYSTFDKKRDCLQYACAEEDTITSDIDTPVQKQHHLQNHLQHVQKVAKRTHNANQIKP